MDEENENLLSGDDHVLHSVLQNEVAYDNSSMYRGGSGENDPFDGYVIKKRCNYYTATFSFLQPIVEE